MVLVYNSDLIAEADFRLSPTDRAFSYGDGLFETLRYENGHLWFWPDHLARLGRGLDALGLMPPAFFNPGAFGPMIDQLLAANDLTDRPARVRVQVWRRPGGLYTPTNPDADFVITAQPTPPFALTARDTLVLYPDMRLVHSPVSGVKTISALPYVLAGQFRRQRGYDDVVLMDPRGNVAECVASNLFWFRGDTLYTPSPDTGCVEGIVRGRLMKQCLRAGVTVRQGRFDPSHLFGTDLVFCTNVAGVQWFKRVDGKLVGDRIRLLEPLLDAIVKRAYAD